MADLVMLGAPGAGKGTQASLLASKYGIAHIATGDIFRAEAQENTPDGRLIKQYLDRGELVPDKLAIEVIRRRLAQPDARRGFVLDGFPRTVPQAEALDQLLHELDRPLDAVLDLEVDRADLLIRLRHRAGVEHRSDDRPDVRVHRIDVYLEQTQPLVDYYRRQNKLRVIDGSQSPDAVAAEIDRALESLPTGSV